MSYLQHSTNVFENKVDDVPVKRGAAASRPRRVLQNISNRNTEATSGKHGLANKPTQRRTTRPRIEQDDMVDETGAGMDIEEALSLSPSSSNNKSGTDMNLELDVDLALSPPRMDLVNDEEEGERERESFIHPDDEDVRFDAQYPAEYIMDIMSHMRSTELKRSVKTNYMLKQRDINAKMREILIDWLFEVHEKFKLRRETLYLTVNLLDRFLERRAVTRDKLQMVGCTAFFIASKYEEIYCPEIKDFEYITDHTYTRQQFLHMEEVMLSTLKFNLTAPSSLRFSERFVKISGGDSSFQHLVDYLTSSTLQHYSMLQYAPSLIAASAVYVARQIVKPGCEWDETMREHTEYEEEDLLKCSRDMLKFVTNEDSQYQAVRRKYSKRKYNRVSLIPITLEL